MIDFLDVTDDLLRQGAVQLSPGFRQAQIDFVLTQQADDGGFVGSAGPADLYYTDFAVRCLVILDGPDLPLRRAGGWVERQTPADVIHCFCALNIRRLLRTRGVSLGALPRPSPIVPRERVYEPGPSLAVQGGTIFSGTTEHECFQGRSSDGSLDTPLPSLPQGGG